MKIDKLINGGQGLGKLDNGQVVLVWNALPGEEVRFTVIKQKHSYLEATAEEIIKPSPQRLKPRDDLFLSTSPWQILDSSAESEAKLGIVKELMQSAKVGTGTIDYHDSPKQWHYRNKMEYSFWGDDDGLHLALHGRGSHQKQIVSGSSLAMPAIDKAAQALLTELMRSEVRATELKTVVVRSSRSGQIVMSLFVKQKEFDRLRLPDGIQGINIYYSNPKSPASVPTKLLKTLGSPEICDELNGKVFCYSSDSFFQVNLDVFELVLKKIHSHIDHPGPLVDMYAGVGTIGLSMDSPTVELVEISQVSAEYAVRNAKNLKLDAKITVSGSENALAAIPSSGYVIFDPPRAGLSKRIIDQLLKQKTPCIIYLSCNPATLARDLSLLQSDYSLASLDVYNFFPKTPHIETLAVLNLKSK